MDATELDGEKTQDLSNLFGVSREGEDKEVKLVLAKDAYVTATTQE